MIRAASGGRATAHFLGNPPNARARPAITHDFASIFEAFGEKRSRRRQIRATMAQPIAEEGMR
jgi:hypothetical protein